MAKPKLQRIDQLLVERGIAADLERASALLLSGSVRVAGVEQPKPGTKVREDIEIECDIPSQYVSRAGIKLASGLDHFKIEVADKVCADVGAATGGFSDVFLQRRARQVFAIDVGYGDLAWKVRSDSRLVPIERTNARYLKNLPTPPEVIAIDVSFISLTLLIEALQSWNPQGGTDIVALVKPQFEAASEEVGTGGVITDDAVHQRVLERVTTAFRANGFSVSTAIPSPILGSSGNKEFLIHLRTPARA